VHVIVSKYINDRGLITGAGVFPNGDEHAVLFIPCNDDGDDCRDGSQGIGAAASGRAVSSVSESRPAQTLQEVESGSLIGGPFDTPLRVLQSRSYEVTQQRHSGTTIKEIL
jgi:hypothetical protein